MFWRLFLTYVLLIGLAVIWAATLLLHRIDVSAYPELAYEAILVGSTVIGLSTIPAFIFARRFVRPLHELTEGARQIAGGHYGHQIQTDGVDDVQTLAQTFNGMSRELNAQFKQLENDRQQLRTVLGGMIEGVIAIDAEERLLFVNDRAARLLDFDPTTAISRKFWEVVRHPPIQELFEKSKQSVEPTRQELDWIGPGMKSLAIYVARMPDSPRAAVMVLHDITDLKRLERLRQDFVANVSHELKTPLSVIHASIETLLDGAVEDEQARTPFLEQIAEQTERLHALIIDLLHLARIEAGGMELDFQAVPLAVAVADCIDRHYTKAESNQQNLIANPPDELIHIGLTVWADEEALGQILDNLVDNALKYTPPGGTIQVRWSADDTQVLLEVEDNGIGIPERDLPRIFERFYRVDKARSREVGGTGLGLAIVKHLVQTMQGSIRVSSQIGQGTRFTVCLPRARDV